ncbi:hypothetical protein [Cupriavidus sp. BIC8F]|uniref:hypothetical protein n=1 Tax=Cupriavidus sp. BIC8F TaxID=3079014 RepID=UPI0029167521|nr:hypothetical protein [Cupriavidus sp. BIC8F]
MPATSVKTFYSFNGSAPVLHGNPGSLISVLDACLKDGFNPKTLDSLVVAGGVATAVVGAGHGYSLNQVMTLAGAAVGALNADWRITFANATTFKFACPGVADGTIGGTITAKLTPLGWAKPFSGTNLAAYKSNDPQSYGTYLRVDDTGSTARIARVWGCESMTDINSYSGLFPTATQVSGGAYWGKSSTQDAVSRPWIVMGDERCFYLWMAPNPTSVIHGVLHFFGDILAQGGTDQWAVHIAGPTSDKTSAGGASYLQGCCSTNADTTCWFARSYTQLGSAVAPTRSPLGGSPSALSYSGAAALHPSLTAYPNPIDGALFVGAVALFEGGGLRGTYPGMYYVINGASAFLNATSHIDAVTGIDSLPGKTLQAVKVGTPGNASTLYEGCVLMDNIGPWRT